MMSSKKELSIYIHIPFCKAKCSYCDFISFGGCSISEQREYIDALCKEISAYSLIADEYKVITIFIGGGTPSYIHEAYIGRVLETVKQTFDVEESAEITIEGNPDSLTSDKLAAYISYGINRLSIGLQSTNDDMLKVLGRVHNYDQFIAAYSRARQAGFTNINIDIMSGLPGESTESYVRTLAKACRMHPEHISAYSLIVEDGTPLSENAELLSRLPTEEEDRKQYARTKMLLERAGYMRYEISNYAKIGYECRHNLTYWTGGEYLGVGLAAASYMKVCMEEQDGYISLRFKGVDSIDEYIGRFSRLGTGWKDILSISELICSCYTDIQVLNAKDEMEEFMFLGLRCIRGISRKEFRERFGKDIQDIYGDVIERYSESGHIICRGDSIYLSDKGIDVSNVIMAEFLL